MRRTPARRIQEVLCFLVTMLLSSTLASYGQALDDPEELKKLTLEELMELTVTSISRRPEKLTGAPSAIQVLTYDDIRRSGATNIPEALRLVPNLQVAQLNSSAWIISARGFNATYANKLLVMIDGRTVYSPLFAGVFWDVQHVLLEDVDRIEVISGPGGTAWGANAVNGVINIITKSASATQGLYATVGTGNFLRKNAALRYGGKIGESLSYRVYGMYGQRDSTWSSSDLRNHDGWHIGQGGLSLEWKPGERDQIVAFGNFNFGEHHNAPEHSTLDGQNILTRWSRNLGEGSELVVQAYYDRTWRRDKPSTISDQSETYDLDIDHSFSAGDRHKLVWGLGYRFVRSQTYNATNFIGLVPRNRDMPLYSAFIQDDISLIKSGALRLVIGSKLQHNIFDGFQLQPSTRMVWAQENSSLWAATSLAIRAPSRIDVDYHLPVDPLPPNMPSVAGGPNFEAEKVSAFELGYRWQPSPKASMNIATFFNKYHNLYSVDSLPNTYTYQIQNGTRGISWGLEASGRVQVTSNWQVRGGYTYFRKDLSNKPGHTYDYSDLGNDARNRIVVQSVLDLPANFEFDVSFRYIDPLPKPKISDYMTFDARLAWVRRSLEFAVVGQNLWEGKHREFYTYIPRNVYGSITCRF